MHTGRSAPDFEQGRAPFQPHGRGAAALACVHARHSAAPSQCQYGLVRCEFRSVPFGTLHVDWRARATSSNTRGVEQSLSKKARQGLCECHTTSCVNSQVGQARKSNEVIPRGGGAPANVLLALGRQHLALTSRLLIDLILLHRRLCARRFPHHPRWPAPDPTHRH